MTSADSAMWPSGFAALPGFVKGHATENDFVIIPDLDSLLLLTPELVRALCDRRAGIGADGVLRVVRTILATEPNVLAQADVAEFFMDYRNGDGSIAEMCGNGARLFAAYLAECGLIGKSAVIATRGGPCEVSIEGDSITVVMGRPRLRPERPAVTVGGVTLVANAASVDMPNPHVVVTLSDPDDLVQLDLSRPPGVEPALPAGQNVEFVAVIAERHLRMRVYERGVGETRSCGTGVCAVVAALSAGSADSGRWRVDVPGGTCWVQARDDGQLTLTGPAVIVARIDLADDGKPRAGSERLYSGRTPVPAGSRF